MGEDPKSPLWCYGGRASAQILALPLGQISCPSLLAYKLRIKCLLTRPEMKEDTYKGEVQGIPRGCAPQVVPGAVTGRGSHVQPVTGLTDCPSQQQAPANFSMALEEKLGAWNRYASAGQL